MNKDNKNKTTSPEGQIQKGVFFKEQDFEKLIELLKDPVLRDALPKDFRNKKRKRNAAVLWCVSEFVKILNNRQVAHQTSLSFRANELEDLRRQIKCLEGITAKLSEELEALQKKKKWWQLG